MFWCDNLDNKYSICLTVQYRVQRAPHRGRVDVAAMSSLRNNTQNGGDDYVWQYEYYDEEEPVSFEGLKANRCKYL